MPRLTIEIKVKIDDVLINESESIINIDDLTSSVNSEIDLFTNKTNSITEELTKNTDSKMYLTPRGEAIKQKREEKGLSKNKLSLMANLGKYAVARMENGTHKVHILRAQSLCKVLDCKIEELFEVN